MILCCTFCLVALAWSGCFDGEFHDPWREQKLPSGKSVKIKSLQIAWGIEHDEPRSPEKDCFNLMFVYSAPAASAEAHAQEAKEVFELIRPISEQWGFKRAEVMAYFAPEHDVHYDAFSFERSAAGEWSGKFDRHF
ncbi:MAG TPA: hypothetical protein VG838_03950 [Opitutaceae bacterium]|nr:hypothetical protein [Opitutaceae bacterium]